MGHHPHVLFHGARPPDRRLQLLRSTGLSLYLLRTTKRKASLVDSKAPTATTETRAGPHRSLVARGPGAGGGREVGWVLPPMPRGPEKLPGRRWALGDLAGGWESSHVTPGLLSQFPPWKVSPGRLTRGSHTRTPAGSTRVLGHCRGQTRQRACVCADGGARAVASKHSAGLG